MITPKDKAILQKFGANIKAIRLQKGFTLLDLEAKGSIDNSTLSKIERGEKNITVTTLVKIAETLEVPPKDLFDYLSQ